MFKGGNLTVRAGTNSKGARWERVEDIGKLGASLDMLIDRIEKRVAVRTKEQGGLRGD